MQRHKIQGAVLPVAEKFRLDSPFLGAVLAGIFTEGALKQLSSLGFEVAYLPYDTIVDAFARAGVDARFDESTPDVTFSKCVAQIVSLPKARRTKVKRAIFAANRQVFESFFEKLRRKLDRSTDRVTVLPLFGDPLSFGSATEAAAYMEGFDCAAAAGQFRRYEVTVVFTNRDEVRGIFGEKDEALKFLQYVTS